MKVLHQATKIAPWPITPSQHKNEHFEVPFDNNKNYVDRPSITNQLESLLGYSEAASAFRTKRVVLYGLGGSGKTEIAIRFAESHRHHYSAVFWVHGADEARLHVGFERIGKVVNRGSRSTDDDHVIEAQTWLTRNCGWLLIIDNVNDDAALGALRGRYLKGGMDGHMIMTSRNPTASAQWNGIEIADMERSEAVALMLNVTGRDIPQENSTMIDLLEDLGHLPLAIDQASSYIAATEISLLEYRRWFQVEKARLLEHLPSTQYDYDSRETVMTTWELSFKRVEKVNTPASRLLLLMSCFSHYDIPIDVLELSSNSLRHWAPNGEFEELPEAQIWIPSELRHVLENSLRLREAMLALRKFSFIRYKSGGNAIWIHPLVHYWTSRRLDSSPHRQLLTTCSIGLVASSFEREERLPPIVTPHAERDIASVLEERSLRLWPWRQYPKLAPHAHRCMQYVTSLTNMPESIAHLSLSLLQVFEYLSTGDEPVHKPYRLDSDHAYDLINHVSKFGEAPDNILSLSIILWRLTRAVACPCQKDARLKMKERCHRCREACTKAIEFIGAITEPNKVVSSARIRATSLDLLFVFSLNHSQFMKELVRRTGQS